ncbi:MAG: nicotinate-nicotinamide nucleotide adenylyltransferase, partial [Acidobacteria bacterium]
MNIGLFGGTFDPVHRGHLALARVALEHYKLHRVHFVPANVPPHKQRQPHSLFLHR